MRGDVFEHVAMNDAVVTSRLYRTSNWRREFMALLCGAAAAGRRARRMPPSPDRLADSDNDLIEIVKVA
jgi:hypothetical protein